MCPNQNPSTVSKEPATQPGLPDMFSVENLQKPGLVPGFFCQRSMALE